MTANRISVSIALIYWGKSMYLVNRGLSPAFQLAALTVLCAMAKRCGGLIDDEVLSAISQLASVGTATLSTGDRQCHEAFWKLLGPDVSAVEWKIATVFTSHLDTTDDNYAAVIDSISEMGWTIEDIHEMARSGPIQGGKVLQFALQPPPLGTGLELVKQDEAAFFSSESPQDVRPLDREPTNEGD